MRLLRFKPFVATLLISVSLIFGAFFSPLSAQTADSTRQQVIEDIQFLGNTKTQPAVILRHMTIRTGQAIDVARIEESLQRLSHTNFFKEVDFFTKPGSEKGKIIVVIEVKEREWPYFQFEGGHSDLGGWFFVPASIRFDNFFGHGNYLGLRWILGHRIEKVALGFRTLNLFSNRGYLDIELFDAEQTFIHYFDTDEAEQKVEFSGLKFQVGGNEGVSRYLFAAFRFEEYQPERFLTFTETDLNLFPPNIPPDIADDLETAKIRTLSLGVQADRRDNSFFPTDGYWGAISADFARTFFNGDVEFSRITFDGRLYRRLNESSVLALHLKGGLASDDTPFYERFFLGGANSLRGYGDSRLTPIGWGTKLATASAEVRIPISKRRPNPKTSLVLFFDAGGIWLPGQSPELDDIYTSAGFGFRAKLPVVGTTRFDFAFPLRNVDNNDFQFHISLGHTF